MPFLTVNGHTFPVADNTGKRKVTRKGRRTRAYRGQMRDGTRGQRRQLSFKTCFTDHEEAQTFIRTLHGEGHVIYFTRGWDAATGLTPEIGNLNGITFDRTLSPFSSSFEQGSLVVGPSSSDVFARYDAQLDDEWTLHFWYNENGVGWHPATKLSDGRFFEDGLSLPGLWEGPFDNISIRVVEGRVELAGEGNPASYLHHLAIMPYLVDESFITTWHAATKPWGEMPLLRVEGDALLTDHEFFFGEVTGVQYIQFGRHVDGLGWVNNGQEIDFTLHEFQPGFVSA